MVNIDKIRGVLYGQAIGDALGKSTEYMTRDHIKKNYGKPILPSFKYENIVQDYHRSTWKVGDWTDDTDLAILTMQIIIDDKGIFNWKTLRGKINKWFKVGISECEDNASHGAGYTMSI